MTLFQKPFERRIEFTRARNWLKPEAHRNYGHIGQNILFVLIGAKGAVSWTLSPGWYIKSTREAWIGRDRSYDSVYMPDAWDLSQHSYEPQYEGQTCNSCSYLDGGKCYSDGTSLGAKELIEPFLAGGTEWLWPYLEKVYASWFEGEEWPKAIPDYLPHPDDVKVPE